MKTEEQKNKNRKANKVLLPVVIILVLLALLMVYGSMQTKPEFTKAQNDSIAHATFIKSQFFGGMHTKSVIAIKELMNDPESFEHVNTTFSESDNKVIVFTKFRGKNSFNATITQTYVTRADSIGNIEFVREYNPAL